MTRQFQQEELEYNSVKTGTHSASMLFGTYNTAINEYLANVEDLINYEITAYRIYNFDDSSTSILLSKLRRVKKKLVNFFRPKAANQLDSEEYFQQMLMKFRAYLSLPGYILRIISWLKLPKVVWGLQLRIVGHSGICWEVMAIIKQITSCSKTKFPSPN